MSDRLKIIRGEDQSFVLKIRTKDGDDPLDLTTADNVTIEFIKSNRGILSLDLSPMPAVKAKITINTVTIIADTAGVNGNSVILNFNGSDTLDEVVDDWNSNNPLNTIYHDGLGTEIIEDGVWRLEGGYNSYTPVEIFGNPVLGRVKINLTEIQTKVLRLGLNQSFTVSIDYGAYPSGNRIVSQFKNELDVVNSLE